MMAVPWHPIEAIEVADVGSSIGCGSRQLLATMPLPSHQQRYCPACRAIYQGALSRCPNDGTELDGFSDDPVVGLQLGDYRLEEYLGEGATGRVYRASHARLSKRNYAVKVLMGDLAMDATMRTRFAHEADAASRLDHPNLVAVHDFGQSESGLFYIVMELVRGQTLGERIYERGHLSEVETLHLTRAICNGLAHAHDKGLVHRDFKPENVVVLEQDGTLVPRILDFGLAIIQTPEEESTRLTATGGIVGTPAYAAPEQIASGQIDARTDLFALGVTMYEMLAGRLPFDGNIMEILVANAHSKAPSIEERSGVSVTPSLEAIVTRLMAKSKDDRFRSAREVIAALDAIAPEIGYVVGETGPFAAVKPADPESAARISVSDTLLATDSQPSPLSAPGAVAATLREEPAPVPHEESPRRRTALWAAGAVFLIAGAVLAMTTLRSDRAASSLRAAASAPQSEGTTTASAQPQPQPADVRPPVEAALAANTAGDTDDAGAAGADVEAGNASAEARTTGGVASARVAEDEPAAPPKRSPKRTSRGTKSTSATPATDEPPPAPAPPEPPVAEVVDTPPVPIKTPPPVKTPPPRVPLKAPALDAKVSVARIASHGALPAFDVKRAVRAVAPAQYRACYRSAAKRSGRDQATTAKVSFQIDASRRARQVTVTGATLPGLASCIEQAVSAIRTTRAPDVGFQRVSFDIRFAPLPKQ